MRRITMLATAMFFSQYIIAQNVGIGTTNPLSRLHVVSTNPGNIATFNGGTGMFITLTEGVNNRGYIGSSSGNSEDVDFGTYVGSTGKVHLTTSFTPRLTITNTGNVGIGQINPTVPLNFPDLTGNKISLWGTGVNHYGFGIQDFLLQVYTDGPFSDIAFGHGNSTSFMENMRVKGNGNVGIGKTNPVQKLEINGAIRIGDISLAPEAGTIRFNPLNNDFEGYNGTTWKSLTLTQSSSNGIPPVSVADTGSVLLNIGDNLGFAVADIGGLFIAAGAPGDDIGANSNQGSVYVYRKSIFTGQYEIMQQIIAPGGEAEDLFGHSLTGITSSNSTNFIYHYLLIGAPGKNVAKAGQPINNDQGVVYMYWYNPETDQFQYVYTATSQDGAAGDTFGFSIDHSVENSVLMIGAPQKTINGNIFQGRAYKFDLATEHPIYGYFQELVQEKIYNTTTPEPFQQFGYSVSSSRLHLVSGSLDIVAIGSPGKRVNGNNGQGIVYFFLLSGGGTIDSTAVNSDGNAGYTFGFSISGINGIFAIGAPGKENGANTTQGAVYLFKRTTTQTGIPIWVQQSKALAPDGAAGDNFGSSVFLLSDNILSVGAPYADAVAANGGAMYVYEKSYATGNYNFFFRKKITDTQSAADDHLGTVIKRNNSGVLLGIPDFNTGGKNNAGKFMLVDILY
jgi:hypothetical protein